MPPFAQRAKAAYPCAGRRNLVTEKSRGVALFPLRGESTDSMHRHIQCGPFVYRLGRQVFNLKRGVRLP